MTEEVSIPASVRITLGSVEVMAVREPSVFSSESAETGQTWVGGLLLGTRRGCLDLWRGIWAVNLPMSLYATAGTWTWRGPWL